MSFTETQTTADMTMVDFAPPDQGSTQSSKKRKRDEAAPEELEVDVNAPEPPSKKALRKAKKGKVSTTENTAIAEFQAPDSTQNFPKPILEPQVKGKPNEQITASKRSGHGIWVGNLNFVTTKADLISFLTNDTNITEAMITRIHMPAPTAVSTLCQKIKSQNKGFAYVDFSSAEAVTAALALSETLITGRKVLIKDAHNFEGRPEKKVDGSDTQTSAGIRPLGTKGPPTKRIFVGNLPFDAEAGDLEEHFSQCGEVVDIHIATFEDSGKCKGFGWVTFGDTEAATAAVKGWIISPSGDDDLEGELDEGEATNKAQPVEGSKRLKKNKTKARKRWVNSFRGRLLRMEFAEDAAVRYKKRFGKDAVANKKTSIARKEKVPPQDAVKVAPATEKSTRPQKKLDARNVKPGAALAAAPRLTGSIVASQGKKITFD